MNRKYAGLPENDPEKARISAWAELEGRMSDRPEVLALAITDRETAICNLNETRCLPSPLARRSRREAAAAEVAYLDAKYGYGIRPWLPICWAGWTPAQTTE